MRISYAIPVCNELEEIQKLLDFLQQYIRQSDQLVIMIDDENGNNEVEDYVEDFLIVYKDRIDMRIIYHPLDNDFAST
jgi:hypothetical protein